MSGWQFSFPPSRTCLWDGTPTDSPCELHITRNSWLHIRISTATLTLALRHAKQSRRKLFDCFLIATAWITDGEGIAVEVDRFDPGRPLPDGSGLSPTTLIPGDIVIASTLAVHSHPHAKHLTHNMESLRGSITTVKQSLTSHNTPLDPSLLLSLKIHCTYSESEQLSVECACVYPGLVIEATPIQPIPIVQTALARNLSGPLSLSVIQGKAKHGFVTMEAARKLVLLLHSDPKAATLPLVGVWVSGVSSVYHPLVWMSCAMYSQSSALTDRVWGEERSFLVLVYLQGSTVPQFSQCVLKNDGNSVQLASGESSLSMSSAASLISFELYPVQESTVLYTLFESVITPSLEIPQLTRLTYDLIPLPSPQPTPTQVPPQLTRDSELSMVSCLSLSEQEHSLVALTPPTTMESHRSSGVEDKENNVPVNDTCSPELNEGAPSNQSLFSEEEDSLIVFPDKLNAKMTPRSANTRRLLKQQEAQLKALQEQVNTLLLAQTQSPASLNTTPKVEVSTSTGESLYWPHPPSTQSHFTPTHSTPSQPSLFTAAVDSAHSTPSRLDQEESMCSSTVSGVSVETVTSILSHNVSDMHLDLHSYAQSPSPPSFGDSASVIAGDDPLQGSDPQQVYQNMLTTVNALLNSQEDDSPPRSDAAPGVSHISTEHSISATLNQKDEDTSHSTTLSQSLSHSSNSLDEQNTVTLNNDLSNHSNLSSKGLPKASDSLSHNDHSRHLPYLHPDVLGQRYGSTEVSLLPVPRIIAPVPSSNTTLDTGAPLYLRGPDSTLDENMQLADMIAMKYLGDGKEGQHPPRPTPTSGDTNGSVLETDLSLATHQYLQRHHLLAHNDKPKPPPLSKETPPLLHDTSPLSHDTQDNILNIRRLKQLPKLI